jgi:hypothetical protein
MITLHLPRLGYAPFGVYVRWIICRFDGSVVSAKDCRTSLRTGAQWQISPVLSFPAPLF